MDGDVAKQLLLTQNTIAAAVHGEAAGARVAREPVVLSPDVYVGETLEVARLVLLIVCRVAPEEAGHAGEGLADDQLACVAGVVDRGAGSRVHDVDVHAQSADLHFAGVDWARGVEGYE